jgi:hypothetical protein
VNDLLGPYDVIQPSIQKNTREFIGVKHRNSVSSSNVKNPNEKPNGSYPQKKPDIKNVESGKHVEGKVDGRSQKEPHVRPDQKLRGLSQPGPNHEKRERKKSVERDHVSHKTLDKNSRPLEKESKSTEEIAKQGSKHSAELTRKNSLKHVRQPSAEKDVHHGHRRSADRDNHRRKSSERDGSQGHGSAERDVKREDRSSASSSSGEGRSASVDRQQGVNRKEHSEQQTTQKPHRSGNIFSRLKNDTEDLSSNNAHSNSNSTNERDSSKTPVSKETDALKSSAECQRIESASSVASNSSAANDPFSSASQNVKKETSDAEKAKSRDRSMQPPNGIMVNGAFVKDASKLKEAQKNLPKLKISNEVSVLLTIWCILLMGI